MLRMQGNTAEIVRWAVRWTEPTPHPGEDGETVTEEKQMEESAVYADERDAIKARLMERGVEFEVEELGVEDELWIEGKQFENRDEAVAALAAGEGAYAPPVSAEEMLLELDFRTTLLEMGVTL